MFKKRQTQPKRFHLNEELSQIHVEISTPVQTPIIIQDDFKMDVEVPVTVSQEDDIVEMKNVFTQLKQQIQKEENELMQELNIGEAIEFHPVQTTVFQTSNPKQQWVEHDGILQIVEEYQTIVSDAESEGFQQKIIRNNVGKTNYSRIVPPPSPRDDTFEKQIMAADQNVIRAKVQKDIKINQRNLKKFEKDIQMLRQSQYLKQLKIQKQKKQLLQLEKQKYKLQQLLKQVYYKGHLIKDFNIDRLLAQIQ